VQNSVFFLVFDILIGEMCMNCSSLFYYVCVLYQSGMPLCVCVLFQCARNVQKYFQEKAIQAQKAEKVQELRLKKIASFIAKEIKTFWSNVEKVTMKSLITSCMCSEVWL